MVPKFLSNPLSLAWCSAVLVIVGYIFFTVSSLPQTTDFYYHMGFVQDIASDKGVIPPHFLFFILTLAGSGFSTDIEIISIAGVIVLTFAVLLKYLVTKYLFDKTLPENMPQAVPSILGKAIGNHHLLAFAFIFLMNMPVKPPWTSVLPPISWHNSTVIALFPVAMWLFWVSFSYLQLPSKRKLAALVLFCSLSLLIKPNFGIVFFLVFPLFALARFKFSKRTLSLALLLLVPALIIAAQFAYTFFYMSAQSLNEHYSQVHVVVEPFSAWRKISGNLLLSYLGWMLYPTLFLMLYLRKAFQSYFYNYSLAYMLGGLLIFVLLTEKTMSGTDIAAVNFLWQVIICVYLWHMVTFITHLRTIQQNETFGWKDYLLFLSLGYFLFSGVMYLVNTVFLRLA